MAETVRPPGWRAAPAVPPRGSGRRGSGPPPTHKVVVIGAGIGGLVSSLLLAARGLADAVHAGNIGQGADDAAAHDVLIVHHQDGNAGRFGSIQHT